MVQNVSLVFDHQSNGQLALAPCFRGGIPLRDTLEEALWTPGERVPRSSFLSVTVGVTHLNSSDLSLVLFFCNDTEVHALLTCVSKQLYFLLCLGCSRPAALLTDATGCLSIGVSPCTILQWTRDLRETNASASARMEVYGVHNRPTK